MAVPGSLPAVSGLNGKVSVFGGSQDGGGKSGGMFGVAGSLWVPMGFAYGLQVDGMAGSGHGAAFYGIGGHLFWRDPAKGLVGLYSSYLHWDFTNGATTGFDIGKFGVEGAAYLGRFSLEGLAAYQFGSATVSPARRLSPTTRSTICASMPASAMSRVPAPWAWSMPNGGRTTIPA